MNLGEISLINKKIIFILPSTVSDKKIIHSDNIILTGNKIEINPIMNSLNFIQLNDENKGISRCFYFQFTSKNTELIHSTSIKSKTEEKSCSKSSQATISRGSAYGKIYFLFLQK